MKKTITLLALALCLKLTAQIPTYIPTNGLVGCYLFNGNLNDLSSSNNNCTDNGATLTTDRFGSSNSAYIFNGTSNYLTSSFAPLTNVPFTISTWVNINHIGASLSPIISLGEGGSNNLSKMYFSSSVYSPSLGHTQNPSIGCGGADDITTTQSVDTNTWAHLVVVCSNFSTNGTIFYINNVAYTNNTIEGANIPIPTNNSAFTIGKHTGNGGVSFFNGVIDDILIYNRVLNDSEINQLYTASTTTTIKSNKIKNLNIFTYNDLIKIDSVLPNSTIKVLNSLGQIVFESISKDEIQTNLQTGIYTIQILNNNEIVEIKKCALINNQ